MSSTDIRNESQFHYSFAEGVRDSLPIAAGYFAVSFSFGILVSKAGLSSFVAGLMSLTNVTSAGQFAGLKLYTEEAAIAELIVAMIIINLRYALLSLSLSQRLEPSVGFFKRLLIAFGNTDEIFAVSVSKQHKVGGIYMAGLEIPPILAWTLGSVVGAIANDLLPVFVQSALGVALYAMFIAIVLPPARKEKSVAIVVVIALAMSCLFYYVPLFKGISSGMSIILCTVLSAALGAALFPVKEAENEQ